METTEQTPPEAGKRDPAQSAHPPIRGSDQTGGDVREPAESDPGTPIPGGQRDDIFNFVLEYQQLMMLYEGAIKCVTTRLEIMQREYRVSGRHPVIRSVTSRIKEPASIRAKLLKRGSPVSVESIRKNLNDVAGVRLICSYLRDIYTVRDTLLKSPQISLVAEKDYIKSPKPNGYRSLHLIVNVSVPLNEGVEEVPCEIQLRTTAMDSWAGLEHQLRYKRDIPHGSGVDQELERCAELLYQTDLNMQDIARQLGIFAD